MIEIALTTFAALFVVIDPIGLMPLFAALTRDTTPAMRRSVALRGSLVGFAILLVFGLAGEGLLDLIGIGMPAFRISGGLLLFLIAVEMLFERRSARREKSAGTDTPDTGDDPSVFPLATPFIAGPGALAAMILLTGEYSGDPVALVLVHGVMALVVMSAYILFLLSGLLDRLIGKTGINMITRLLGMLLAALSVQFIVDGLIGLGVIAGTAG